MAGKASRHISDRLHILVVHQGAIGDLILSLPCFYALRTKFPSAHIEVMGYPRTLSLIHKRFYADDIVSVDRAWVASLYNEDSTLNNELIQYLQRFAKIVIFGGTAQAVVINNIKRVNEQQDAFIIRTIPASPAAQHIIDFQLRQLAMHGFNTTTNTPTIYLSADDVNQAHSFFSQHGFNSQRGLRIAIHPGSGSKHKNWMLQNYCALIQELYKRYAEPVLIVQGPAEYKELQQLPELLCNTEYVVLNYLDLPVLAAILSRCNLYIGNDSGITHLAAAAGVPTIALFGPTDPHIWGPRGRQVFVVRELTAEGPGWKWCSTDAVKGVVLQVLGESGF